jgi:hypothetical protein
LASIHADFWRQEAQFCEDESAQALPRVWPDVDRLRAWIRAALISPELAEFACLLLGCSDGPGEYATLTEDGWVVEQRDFCNSEHWGDLAMLVDTGSSEQLVSWGQTVVLLRVLIPKHLPELHRVGPLLDSESLEWARQLSSHPPVCKTAAHRGHYVDWARLNGHICNVIADLIDHRATTRAASGDDGAETTPHDGQRWVDANKHAVAAIAELLNAQPNATGAAVAENPPPYSPTSADLNILQALAESEATLHQVDIENASGERARMVKDRLRVLERAGLVERPHGERKGYSITPEGRQVGK